VQATQTMCSIIRDPDHKVSAVDMSGNLLTEEMIGFVRMAMSTNKSLVTVDLRRNPGYVSGIFNCRKFGIFCFIGSSFVRRLASNS
jgi:hypothetical protein